MAEKTYLTISELALSARMPPHTLRYWEARGLLRPLRLASGHRRYTKADLETVTELKDLLFLKGYTLAGAKKFLRARRKPARPGPGAQSVSAMKAEALEQIRKELRQFIKEL